MNCFVPYADLCALCKSFSPQKASQKLGEERKQFGVRPKTVLENNPRCLGGGINANHRIME